MTVRPLADLGPGASGRIAELRLPPGRTAPGSPLRPGAQVYVAEAPGGRWLHVRIDFREYSVPIGVAEDVLVELPEQERPPTAADAYAVLVSRLDRRSWRVRVIERSGGAVVHSEWFDDEPAARARFGELRADADGLDAEAFRARYRLP